MLKKIVVGTLVLGLSGILVIGAINRTTDRLERETRNEGSRQGRQAAATEGLDQRYGRGQGEGKGEGQGERQAVDANIQLGRGNQGKGEGDQESGGVADSLQESGVVTGINEEALVFASTEGETLIIEGRTWMYARDQGFEADVGDQLEISGFYEDGEWKTTEIENLSNGLGLVIRSGSGRPMWAGRGRQG